MRRVGLVVGALVLVLGALVPALAQQPFADVPLNHWAYSAVNSLAEKGLIEGYPDGTFKGKQPLTRYEFAQAIARLVDRLETMKGIPGPKGDKGEPGAPGAPGGGAGLTPEQQASLDRLAKEFAPELRSLRSDLDNLTKRVEELEARPVAKGPVITVGGDISVRAGAYGTKLGFDDVKTTGYPYFAELQPGGGGGGMVAAADNGYFFGAVAPYGGINLPFFDPQSGLWSDDSAFVGGPVFVDSIPISDALKDSFKASDFLTQRTRVILSGPLAENTNVKTVLLADARGNNPRDALLDAEVGSPNAFTGNGVMDTVKVDEAWVSHRTSLLAPVDIVVGKQYVSRGVGLLADNSQEALKGVRLDWSSDRALSWGLYLAMLDREQFFGASTGSVGLPTLVNALGMYTPETSGQDNYNLYYLDWKLSKSWALGANWLGTGFAKEQGWSASLNGKLYGLDCYGEFAQLRKWPSGEEFVDANANGIEDAGELTLDDAGDSAWLAGLKWSGDWLSIMGEYGQLDAGYVFAPEDGWSVVPGVSTFNLPLSALHPLAEVSPHYINWVDRPLFLDPTNIAKGWHVGVVFPKLLGKKTPVGVSYASGDAFNPRFLSWLMLGGPGSGIAEPDKWRDADPVWTVQFSHQLSDSVTANLLYGRREVDNVMSRQDVPVVVTGVGTFLADDDPIQVIRAELAVQF